MAENSMDMERFKEAINKAIGGRIARVRGLRGKTLEQIGAQMRPPRAKQTISGYESGLHSLTYGQIVEIAGILTTTVHFLTSGIGDPAAVVMDPLEVAGKRGVRVPVYDLQADGGGSGDDTVEAPYDAEPQDGMAVAFDGSMMPEIKPGDQVFFRKGARPKPRDLVWAKDTASGEHMLRQYRQSRGDDGMQTSYSLVPLSEEYGITPEGASIQILGVVKAVTRVY